MAFLLAEIFPVMAPVMQLQRRSRKGNRLSNNNSNRRRPQQQQKHDVRFAPNWPPPASTESFGAAALDVDAGKFMAAMHSLRALLDYATDLMVPPATDEMKQQHVPAAGLCGADWCRIILALIIACRCSFPLLPSTSGLDYRIVRQVLNLGTYLERLTADVGGDSGSDDKRPAQAPRSEVGEEDSHNGRGAGTDGGNADESSASKDKQRACPFNGGSVTGRIDVATAMRVILCSVKTKFEKKTAACDASLAASTSTSTSAFASSDPAFTPTSASLSTEYSSNSTLITTDTATTTADFAGMDMDPALLAGLGPGPGPGYPTLQEDIQLCPMLDGSLSEYLSMWDRQEQEQRQQGGGVNGDGDFGGVTTFDAPAVMGMMEQGGTDDVPAAYQDLWAAMTVGWAGDATDIGLGGDDAESHI